MRVPIQSPVELLESRYCLLPRHSPIIESLYYSDDITYIVYIVGCAVEFPVGIHFTYSDDR